MSRYRAKQIGVDKDYIDYVSPTQVLGMLSKGDGLIQWACNLCVEKNDRFAWKAKRDNTADIGSQLHRYIECFINLKLKKKYDEKDFFNWLRYDETVSNNLEQMFYQFYNWQKKNVKQFLESEKPVIHRNLAYGGTVDFLYKEFDDKIYLCDLKTANSIYDTHQIQVVAYKYARENMIKIEYDNFGYKCNELPTKYQIEFNQDGNSWTKIFEYPIIKIDHCCVLKISRDYFDLEFKIIKDVENKMKAFECLLGYYYCSAKRQLNNFRARERK